MKNGIILDLIKYLVGVLIAVVIVLAATSVGIGWLNMASWLAVIGGGILSIGSLGVALWIGSLIYKDVRKKYIGGESI